MSNLNAFLFVHFIFECLPFEMLAAVRKKEIPIQCVTVKSKIKGCAKHLLNRFL